MGYLDSAGLSHFTAWVKARLSGKQDALTPDGSVRLQGGNIGVALPTKAVTKAEYDALTEAEKQAETVYLVEEPAWEPVPLSIQEYDTENGWHVRKWSDGYIEFVRTLNWETSAWTAWNFPYYKFSQEGNLPFALSEIDSIDFYIIGEVIPGGDEGVSGTIVSASDVQKNGDCKIVLYSLGTPERSYTVSEKITGRWK